MNPARKVVVVGGGIAGLVAAYRLARHADTVQPLEVTLLEASARLGGKLATTPFMDHDVDEGADAFLRRDPAALSLAQELGLGDRLVSPATGIALIARRRRRRLWRRRDVGAGRLALRPLPSEHVLGVPASYVGLARSGLVGPLGVARAGLDLLMPDNWKGVDEPVGAIVRRRLGGGVADGVVGPLLGGINAGDIDQMEAAAVAPPLAAIARRGGSLMRAAKDHLTEAAASRASSEPPPVFASFDGGMGVLVGRLADVLASEPVASGTVNVRVNVAVHAVSANAHPRWRVSLDDGTHLDADAVVLATPAHQTAKVLRGVAPNVARGLAEVPFASVAIITLGYERASVGARLEAAGALVPRHLGLLMTACSFGSSKWPHWASEDHVVVRASVGRVGDTRLLDLDDDELVDRVASEVSELLLIDGPPLASRVSRWADSMPQYTTGHIGRVRQLRAELAAGAPGLLLAGASYDGLGIPACVRQGTEAAQAAVDHLAHLTVA